MRTDEPVSSDPNLRTCGNDMKPLLPGKWEWVHKVARTWRAETGKIRVVVCTHARCTGDDSSQTNSHGSGSLFFMDKNQGLVGVFKTFWRWTFTNTSAS
jgi:hypothetical protein